jgi:hypothetical protein
MSRQTAHSLTVLTSEPDPGSDRWGDCAVAVWDDSEQGLDEVRSGFVVGAERPLLRRRMGFLR